MESTQSWLEFAVRLFPCAVLFSSLGSSISNFRIYIYVFIQKKTPEIEVAPGCTLFTFFFYGLWMPNSKSHLSAEGCLHQKCLIFENALIHERWCQCWWPSGAPCWPVVQSSVSADTTLTYSLQPYLIQLFHKTLENFKQMFLLRQVTAWLRTGATFSSFILTSQDGAKVGKGDAHFTLSRSVYFEISRNAYSLQSAQIFLRCIFAAKYGTGGQGTRAFPLHLHICFCRTFAEWEA